LITEHIYAIIFSKSAGKHIVNNGLTTTLTLTLTLTLTHTVGRCGCWGQCGRWGVSRGSLPFCRIPNRRIAICWIPYHRIP